MNDEREAIRNQWRAAFWLALGAVVVGILPAAVILVLLLWH